MGAPKGWGPRRGGGPEGVGGLKGGGPKISLFFPCPQNSFFSSLSGGLLVEFWWCLKRRGAQLCTFESLGLSCASPGGPVWYTHTHTKTSRSRCWPKSDWPNSEAKKVPLNPNNQIQPNTEMQTTSIVSLVNFFLDGKDFG